MVNGISRTGYMPLYPSNDNNLGGDGDLTIKKGMTVDYVLAHGSQSQKLFAKTFDFITYNLRGKDDLVYNKIEADTFNNFKFELLEDRNELLITNKATNGTVLIEYNDIEDIENIEEKFTNPFIQFLRDTAKHYESVKIDLKNNTVTISNYFDKHSTGVDLGTLRNFDKIVLNNCERMFDICTNGFEGELILNNVHDRMFGIDRKTLVHAGNAKVTSDLDYRTNVLGK